MATLLTALTFGWSLHAGSAQAVTPAGAPFRAQELLLRKRVAQIAVDTPTGKFPIGTGLDGQLRFTTGWTSGFWAGALWRVVDLRNGVNESGFARGATIRHFGREKTRTHDLGFMYGESSVAAYQRGCPKPFSKVNCSLFRKSGLTASRTLYNLSASSGRGIIPVGPGTCPDCASGRSETIVDSMMNLPLLYWATKTSGDPKYRELAKKHADWVANHLERSDGSTFQAASYARTGTDLALEQHTHQGLNNTSVWARGQAWSLYGFADAGLEFKSKRYLRVAERNANYIATHLPVGELPKWDYKADAAAPRDVSAGVISAAGLFHLAKACIAVKNGCGDTGRWVRLARRMLTASLANIRVSDPVGYLGGQVYTLGGVTSWDDNAELVMGIDYALEAIKLARENYRAAA
jgi:unsaturated chondroitin disaccharide hydrolase